MTDGAKRNFILQQGLDEPVPATCSSQYSALHFQPRLVGPWVVLGIVFQSASIFFALAAVLWWGALFPRLNLFDALYNWALSRFTGFPLAPAPAPRRFSQGMAGTFALAIAVSLTLHWRIAAFVLEGMFLTAVVALVFGGFCLGSFFFHLFGGRAGFARRTLPWAPGD